MDSDPEAHFRSEARDLYDEYAALLALGHWSTPDVYAETLRVRRFIAERPPKDVRPFLNDVRAKARQMRRSLHVIADRRELLDILRRLQEQPDQVLYMTKLYLQSQVMRLDRYGRGYQDLPSHTKIGFTLQQNPALPYPELFLLEARLFEDVAALYNHCSEVNFNIRSLPLKESTGQETLDLRITWKSFYALLRATFVATFNFLEAYLNGIAADYLLTHPGLDPKIVSLLADSPRYVPFREKALQYPRFYLDAKHPPLQESNCPELRLLMSAVKTRDAIVHPSTLPTQTNLPIEEWTSKEDRFFGMELDDLTAVVDAAVGYVRRAEETIGRASVILEWVVPRGEDGRFPSKAFE